MYVGSATAAMFYLNSKIFRNRRQP